LKHRLSVSPLRPATAAAGTATLLGAATAQKIAINLGQDTAAPAGSPGVIQLIAFVTALS
jgi:hypothetical protein